MSDPRKAGTPEHLRGYQRSEPLYKDYANNIFLESSSWDLKLIFGQLDQSMQPPIVQQSAAITIPWVQAKIFSFLLTAHIEGFEMGHGKIVVPSTLIPPVPPLTEEMKKGDPNAERLHEEYIRLREKFFKTA